MSTLLENSLAVLGQEVPLGRVDKALKELWGKDDARTKASLLNFAIYSEDPASLSANMTLMAEITQEHSCRALLILALPSEAPPRARAWITAHCQLHDGHKSVCSEQVSFVLEGGNGNRLRNIVFAHLDSDLSLAFWWQGNLSANFDERLYSVMDLFFIDSSSWKNPAHDFAMLNEAMAQKTAKFRVYDLSWLRSHQFRTAMATCFCEASAIAELASLETISITHAVGHRVAGLLLAAWIGVRLKCELQTGKGNIQLILPEGKVVTISLQEGSSSEALQAITLKSANATFTVNRTCGTSYICTKVEIGQHAHEEMLPADLENDAELIADQLSRLGGQSLYIQILPMLQRMLEA